ncbi:MAG: HAMP domain-containing histidine kinase [Prevotella sp.]|nr:HAMP domain-containing histidine kinase [Prevotella sp.]
MPLHVRLTITITILFIFVIAIGGVVLWSAGTAPDNTTLMMLPVVSVAVFAAGAAVIIRLMLHRTRGATQDGDEEQNDEDGGTQDETAAQTDDITDERAFAGNVSHELRTPLATIIAELDIALQKERTGEEYRKAITEALHDARRMNLLIDGLLNLARAGFHKENIKKQYIRLDELLIDAVGNILKAHPEYNADIVYEDDSNDNERQITVNANPYLLNIAFVNLIDNNCKYSPDNTSMIQISAWQGSVVVRLSDTGIGLSRQDKQHLFKLFYRGQRAKQYNTGYGIGLALAQRIILLHNGQITVQSEQGRGTTFRVELPHV